MTDCKLCESLVGTIEAVLDAAPGEYKCTECYSGYLFYN